MVGRIKKSWNILKKVYQEFSDDDCWQLAAALAYYTVFSLPPLLVLIIGIVGQVVQPADIQGKITQEMENILGQQGAQQIQTMIEQANRPGRGPLAMSVGLVTLLIGATAALSQLQKAMNQVWEVEADPERSGIKDFFIKRLFSLGMIVVIAFLLLALLFLSTALALLRNWLQQFLPAGISQNLLWAGNLIISLSVLSLLFATMFKVLPDVKISWRDVRTGAIVTALLFAVGMFLISIYLGTANVGSAYGAAGSLILILVWIYYSTLIFLVGAEFTQVWARRFGKQIEPSEGAVRMVTEKRKAPEARS